MSGKTALVLLAEGAEEMETVITVDVLRRAEIAVTVAGLAGADTVKCSRGVFIKPDLSLNDVISSKTIFDIVILPGGLKGAEALGKSAEVGQLLKSQEVSGRKIGAICAAPALSLVPHQIGLAHTVTSYPGVKDKIPSTYNYSEERVVVDRNLITSRGPGTTFEFALAIVDQLGLTDRVAKLKEGMLLQH